MSNNQVIILLTPYRCLEDTLDIFDDIDGGITECLLRYLTLSISQQLVQTLDGSILPIREIINGSDLREFIKSNMKPNSSYVMQSESDMYRGIISNYTSTNVSQNYEAQVQNLIQFGKINERQSLFYTKGDYSDEG